MKRILLGLSILAIAGATTFVACKKDEVKKETITTSKTIEEQLTQINIQYNSKNKFSNAKSSWTLKKICNVAVADLAGAWVGTWAGGKIGGAVGTVVGTPGIGTAAGTAIGAAVGGVVVGAGASYGASFPVTSSSGFDPLSVVNVTQIDALVVLSNPNSNPFDLEYGQRHNVLLKSLILTNPTLGPVVPSNMYNNVALSSNEAAYLTALQPKITGSYNVLKSSQDIIATSKTLLNNEIEDLALLAIMNLYIDGLSNSVSYTDAMNLSYAYELAIMNNNSLTTNQKNVVLQGIAVAKYSLNFWDNSNI